MTMATGLAGRIGQLERVIGTDDESRRVIVMHSPGYAESWIERPKWGGIHFHVKTPGEDDDDDDEPRTPAESEAEFREREVARRIEAQPWKPVNPLEHLTPEMRRALRPNDEIVTFQVCGLDARNPHLQMHLPPWKRKPYRMNPTGGDRYYELEELPGYWVRHENE